MNSKNLLNRYLFLGVYCVVFSLNGRDGYVVPDSVRGIKITPQTISQLAPRVPARLQSRLDSWFAEPQVLAMLDRLTGFSDLTAWEKDRLANEELMRALGYENRSERRYVSEIPGGEYLFKIAGQKDRLIGMLAAKGKVLTPEQQESPDFNRYVEEYLKNGEPVPTYNTASGIAYYKLLEDRINKERYRHIFAPKSYLIQLPGKPNTIDDGNVLVVQERVPATKKLSKYPELVTTIDDSVVRELFDAVVALGLWNIKDNILLKQDGSVCVTCSIGLVGLAEQKNSSPKDFFHKNKQRFDENVYVGLVGLLDLFKDDAAKVAYIKKQIRTDSRLKNSPYREKLMQIAQE